MTNHETVKHLRDAQRRLRSVLVANADRLSTPFTDDPSKNPWDTYLRPAMRGLQEAVNAACDALAVAAAVSVPPPAPRADDRTALRDRIAAAIWERQNPGRRYADCEYRWQADAEADADAVLAVLPEPVDRATVLREAAGRYEEILANADTGQDPRYWTAVRDITLGLRAMADEAEQAGGPSREAAEAPHAETQPITPPAHYRRDDGAECCVHTIPVGPDSCPQCRELANAEEQPAKAPDPQQDVIARAVAALQAKAGELSVEAEEELRRDLEEQAQVWHDAAEMVRRVGRKAAASGHPAVVAQPGKEA